MIPLKNEVRDFWEDASCGEKLYCREGEVDKYTSQAKKRYELEPFILEFATWADYKGKRVLEVGVGLGADHEQFARAGAIMTGIDFTRRAVEHTRTRFKTLRLTSGLAVADAENLPFENDSFDLVYSWGVIHHSPGTRSAAKEILRVLNPGGEFKVMIYNKYSCVGYMLWMRYALLRFRPQRSLDDVFATHLESPGTKAYTRTQAARLFREARGVEISTVLTHGDLLTSAAGQRHRGLALSVAKVIWPRWIIKRAMKNHGLFMLIKGKK